jgi:hypothetical protein
MADEPEDPDDELGEAESEAPELWIDAESGYVPDAPALCAEFGILALTMCDGGLTAYVRGKGAVGLGELLKASKPKRGDVRAINTEK